MNVVTFGKKIAKVEKYSVKREENVLTHLRRFAKILGFDNPEDCNESDFNLSKEDRNKLIDDKLTDKSGQTIRNMKSELNHIFEIAIKRGLIKLKEITVLTPKYSFSANGGKMPRVFEGRVAFQMEKYSLSSENWSEIAKKQLEEWRYWSTAELAYGIEDRKKKIRKVTFNSYLSQVENYFGYLYNVKKLDIDQIDFKYINSYDVIKEFIMWHVQNRSDGLISSQVHHLLTVFRLINNNYTPFKNENVGRQISKLKSSLSKPKPRKNIKNHMATFEELMSVAISEYPKMNQVTSVGTNLAMRAGGALAIMLLATIPLRNKNYRECQIGTNLYKNEKGEWWCYFSGREEDLASLKKSYDKNNHENDYNAPLHPKVVPYLEEYLNFWRKLIFKFNDLEEDNNYLLLNTNGKPLITSAFTLLIEKITLKWLGRRINPHSFRHSAATQLLSEGVSVQDVATHINDEPPTVLLCYSRQNQENATKTIHSKYDDKFKDFKGMKNNCDEDDDGEGGLH